MTVPAATDLVAMLPGGFEADWTMVFTDADTGEEYTTDGAHDPDAERPEAAAYWAEVAEAQYEALKHEQAAREALERGDLAAALDALRSADECERQWGDGGTYDHIIAHIIAAVEKNRGGFDDIS